MMAGRSGNDAPTAAAPHTCLRTTERGGVDGAGTADERARHSRDQACLCVVVEKERGGIEEAADV